MLGEGLFETGVFTLCFGWKYQSKVFLAAISAEEMFWTQLHIQQKVQFFFGSCKAEVGAETKLNKQKICVKPLIQLTQYIDK